MSRALTITIHAANFWEILGKLTITGLVGYFVLALVVLTTMDSGWWLPWPIGVAAMAAVVYGVWIS